MTRDKATAQIERIVKAIVAGKFPVKIKELHVFGSYARGAPNPNDLDLILVHDPAPDDLIAKIKSEITKKHGTDIMHLMRVGAFPSHRFEVMMRNVMRQPGEKMDIILATSLEKALQFGQTVANSQRVLIWSVTDQKWRKKLDAIKTDHTAGRYERGHFTDQRRFDCDLEMMDKVCELWRNKVVSLTRIDADTISPELNPGYQFLHERWLECEVMGKECMRLLKYGMWWMQQQRGQGNARPHAPSHDCIMRSAKNKYAVYFGRPPLHAVYRLRSVKYRFQRICLIPHFKRGQKNELFVFDRGEQFSTGAFDSIWDRVPPRQGS